MPPSSSISASDDTAPAGGSSGPRADGAGRRRRLPWGFLGALAIIVMTESVIAAKRVWFLDEATAMWEEKNRLISERSVDADILALGSSRTMHGLVPAEIEDTLESGWTCYNMGLSGMLTPGSTVQLERLLDGGAKPRIVLFEIVMHHLNNAVDESLRPHHLRALYTWPELADLLYWRPQPLRAVEWGVYAALPSARYRRGLDNFLSHTLIDRRVPTFYHDRNLSIRDEFERNSGYRPWRMGDANVDVVGQGFGESLTIEPGVQHCVNRVMSLCRTHEARCVLVPSPVNENRLALLEQMDYLEWLERWLEQLDQEDDNTYVAPTFVLPANLFGDATHLNTTGAAVFSRRLGEWLAQRRTALGLATDELLAMTTKDIQGRAGEATMDDRARPSEPGRR
ncbi:MAG: hypothetical protein ACYSVY_17310 [Planctomycetota bacterium]